MTTVIRKLQEWAVSSSGHSRHLTVPSYSAHGTLDDLERIRSATGKKYASPTDVLAKDEYVLSLGNTELFIGSLALTQAKLSSSGRGDITRYWSKRSLEMLLTVAGSIVPEHAFRLNVVTGLPIETFTSANRKRVKEALEGYHEFILNGKPRTADIVVSRVDHGGCRCGDCLRTGEQVKQGAIDIGGRTTDAFVANGQSPILPLCKGKALGVERVAELLSQQVETKYLRALSTQETREVLYAYVQRKPYPALYASGTRISELDLMQWVTHDIDTVGSEIASFVSQAWNDSEHGSVASDVAKVLLVGGGAYYFHHVIASLISHVEVPAHPELANAIGYAALAEQVGYQSVRTA